MYSLTEVPWIATVSLRPLEFGEVQGQIIIIEYYSINNNIKTSKVLNVDKLKVAQMIYDMSDKKNSWENKII